MSVSQSHPSTDAGTHIPRSPVDLAKVKAGDEVLVRMTVRRVGSNDYRGLPYVVCEDPYGDHLSGPTEAVVLAEYVVGHGPRALEVGDRVRMVGWGKAMLRILCIHGPWAWMADPDDSTIQGPLAHLERVS